MNKMIVNHLQKLFVTSDAATIIKELGVMHPAAKIAVLASQSQELEVIIKFNQSKVPTFKRLVMEQI